jgi:F420-dependent oxidoreductase-like protein
MAPSAFRTPAYRSPSANRATVRPVLLGFASPSRRYGTVTTTIDRAHGNDEAGEADTSGDVYVKPRPPLSPSATLSTMRSRSKGKGARSVTPTRTPSSTTDSNSRSVGIHRLYAPPSRTMPLTAALPASALVSDTPGDEPYRGNESHSGKLVDRRHLILGKFQNPVRHEKRRHYAVVARSGVLHIACVTVDDHPYLHLAHNVSSGCDRKGPQTSDLRRITIVLLVKFSLSIGYFGTAIADDFALITEAENLGYDSVWTAEAYGSDAVTPLAWIAARTESIKIGSGVLQMAARTPAMTAMTAATLDQMSGGRFLLGIGVSGPQVVEGWHGRPYGKPLGVTREYVEILRKIFARKEPVTHDGRYFQLPFTGDGATGLGKPLKIMSRPKNPDLPIYIAAIGPKNVELTAEIADGWLPIFFSPERTSSVYQPLLDAGFGLSGENDKRVRFEIAPTVTALVTDDLEAGRLQMKPQLALYIGGMGARGKNFYNDLAIRYGYDEAAENIQSLYLDGKRMEATMAVPDALVDEVCLVGPAGKVRDRLAAWDQAGVTNLIVAASDFNTLRTIAEGLS